MRRTPASPSRAVDRAAERADVRAGACGAARQQLQRGAAACASAGPRAAMRWPPALLAQVLAQELRRCADRAAARARRPTAPGPRGRSSRAARGSRRASTSTQPSRCTVRVAELVVAKRLDAAAAAAPAAPRRTSRRPGAWSCRGCACRPSAPPSGRGTPAPPRGVSKRRPLQRRVLARGRRRDSTLPLRSGSRDAARQRDDAVVREHVAVERIERGVVDVGREHALAQIVEHDDARRRRRGGGRPARAARPRSRVLDVKVSRRTALRL